MKFKFNFLFFCLKIDDNKMKKEEIKIKLYDKREKSTSTLYVE